MVCVLISVLTKISQCSAQCCEKGKQEFQRGREGKAGGSSDLDFILLVMQSH